MANIKPKSWCWRGLRSQTEAPRLRAEDGTPGWRQVSRPRCGQASQMETQRHGGAQQACPLHPKCTLGSTKEIMSSDGPLGWGEGLPPPKKLHPNRKRCGIQTGTIHAVWNLKMKVNCSRSLKQGRSLFGCRETGRLTQCWWSQRSTRGKLPGGEFGTA